MTMVGDSEGVLRIKAELDARCGNGKASKLRGIIVSPEVWAALLSDNEDEFHGTMGTSIVEGNRKLKYTFYVMENPNFPRRERDGFFVPYAQEDYRERYLGREDTFFVRGESVTMVYGVEVKVVNEIMGILLVDGFFVNDVDCAGVIAKMRSLPPRRLQDYIAELRLFGEVCNPPETQWIGKPDTYDYHRTSRTASRGRLLMRRRNNTYEMVGIGKSPKKRRVEVVLKEASTEDPHRFAETAVQFFLPQEVSDFLAHFDVRIPVAYLKKSVKRERWGTNYDPEALGRLRPYERFNDGKKPKMYFLMADFLTTRAWTTNIIHIEVQGDAVWESVKSKHFPPGWDKWPATSQNVALEQFAASLEER